MRASLLQQRLTYTGVGKPMAHRVPVEQQVLIGGVIDKGSARISLLATRLHATTEVERSPRKARWLARLERLTRGTTLAQGAGGHAPRVVWRQFSRGQLLLRVPTPSVVGVMR
jgi:hypothetical protein